MACHGTGATGGEGAYHRVSWHDHGLGLGTMDCRFCAAVIERGITVRQGLRFLRQQLPDILAKRIDVLSPRMIRIIEDLIGDWWRLDERIEHVTTEIEVLARSNEGCRQLMTVPGIGPIIASVTAAAIGDCLFERSRLRRVTRLGAEADVDG